MLDARLAGIWLSVRELAQRARCSEAVASRFLTAGQQLGYVQQIIRPGFDRQPARRVYRLSPAGREQAVAVLR